MEATDTYKTPSKSSQYADLANAMIERRKSVASKEVKLTWQAYKGQLKPLRDGLSFKTKSDIPNYILLLENLISAIETGKSTAETRLQLWQQETQNTQPPSESWNDTSQLPEPLRTQLLRMQAEHKQEQTEMLKRLQDLDQTITTLRVALELPRSSPLRRYTVMDLKSLNSNFSTIIRLHGEYHEIACCFCGANHSTSNSRLFMGWNAMRKHIRSKHGLTEGSLSDGELFDWCSRRTFDGEDVKRMQVGEQPLSGAIVTRDGDGTGTLW
ncbi:hypothetical protein CLAFUW4_08115 [Fulvia fulva]|uniref:uncharacterized protein n=1 Tax=Passalora fulva TaxID=5499 RepID=UPI002852917B|nr:uncharacterized protein CLAFUR5_20251 [Fulvia fulva]KAK4629077.1 hypothetical protein CLAFUR4_08120 [Fulvia fulva]KAK4630175.1 hypothetical protein CLAFUR0_08115 [Fulvia fulva]WMI38825.1 hypothetical protein CLAFUR5_20251 [Fulvia fulva]WPV12719.1 hypothetical protein CLAFUW4_08115 [Fulvia fulva]WPV27305.1 hypothetical protein CLAFUW7_08115 [Fulvia fulva]